MKPAPTPVTSFAQRRLWFLDQLSPGSSEFLLPLALRLRGGLDVPALERALHGVVERHEVLRTRFVAVDGEPRPLVEPPGSVRVERVDARDPDELFARELRQPVDLVAGPPLRVVLARLGHDDHVLLVVVHHIAVDGLSWDVFLRELAEGYRGAAVDPPPLQFTDFARWQRERLTGARLDRLIGHWRTRLTGVTPLALPTDRPRPEFWDGTGDVIRFTVPADVVAGLDAVARRARATRYMVLLAVYQALLSRYTGQTDIAVCTTLSDRSHPDVGGLIGPFVNTVVLRTDLSGRPTFDTLLRRVRETVLNGLSHAEAPFDSVVAAVDPARDLSRHPLAQASFTLVNAAHQPVTLPGLDAELVPPPLRGTTLDVFLDLNLRQDGAIAARLQYATALFDEDTMRRFGSGYVELLRAVIADPEAPTAELARRLAPLPGRERQRLLDRSGGATEIRPTELAVGGEPDAVALVCRDRTVRYGELAGLVGGLAARLAAEGVGRGSPVGVCVERGVWSVVAMLAVWRAGGVYVPLDPALPAERLEFMVAEAGVGCVVGETTVAGTCVVSVDGVEPAPDFPAVAVDPRDLAYVIFTSGSSGTPKAVGVEHRALAAHVAAARDRYGVTAADVVLAFASFSFDASLDQLLPALTAGATVLVRPDEQWLPSQLLAAVERHRISVLNVPPTYWAELAHALTAGTASAMATLRLLILGGEAIPTGPLAAWRALVPHVRVCNAYGPTEAVVTATTHDVTGADPVPIGLPLGGRRVYVVDSRGELVPVGVAGELLVGGVELARGYLGCPGLTAERFVPDGFGGGGGRLYRTGDLVRWTVFGELEFLGRVDEQVKIRGFRVELGEVEAALARCPGVVAAAAAVRPDAQGGQTLAGFVVAEDGVDAAAVRDWCAGWLPHHAVPTEIAFLDALPVNASGKLDRAALPAPAHDRAATGAGYSAPRDETERVIAEIWCEVLGVDRVGIDDGFFDLGGHSLLATMAVSRIAERLGRDVELRTLFENPRIREFGPRVAAARRAGTAGVVPVDRTGPLPMSFAQERLWFLDRMSELGADYVLWFCWRVRGGLDRAAWQGALDDLVARHEVLRTALVEVDGRPAQLVFEDAQVDLEWHELAAGELDRARDLAGRLATRRFDLARPPMVRAGVFTLGGDDCVAVVAFHHVATDGWSKDVVIDELTECYRARLRGRPAELAPVPVQYGDFAVWQRDRAADQERQLEYWRAALADVPVLELPGDRPLPPTRSGRGGAVRVPLAPELFAALEQVACRTGATKFMVLLAAFQAVLGRWSGQTDLTVGTPVAGRDRVELERLVGFFVNTVVLRADLSGEPTFAGFVDRVRQTVLAAFDHQDVPFERLVEELRPERNLSRTPLFQVMFDVQETLAVPPRLDGLRFENFALPWGSAKFDLTATFVLHPDRFALDLEYSADLFDEPSALRLAGHLRRLLETVLADPDVALGAIDLLSARERAELIDLAGRATPETPSRVVISGEPGAVALVCRDRTVRYGELAGLVGGLAARLAAEGVGRGSPVGVCVERGIWSVVAMLAVWRAGGVYVPLDPALPAERLEFMVAEAGVGCVVGETTVPGTRVVSVDGVEPAPDFPAVAVDPRDLAYVIFTSGSTGRPKAVGVEHAALAAHVDTARELFGITAADVVLNFASFSFDASLEQVLPALTAGARVVVRPEDVWSVEELAERVRVDGVTIMEATPAYWVEVVARLDEVADDLASLRLCVTGGDVLPAAPLDRWFARLPHVPVVNTYGPTESVISTTARQLTTAVDGRVPIGLPLGGRRVYVVDSRGELVPVGVAGELLVGGVELARGYLGCPGLTAERFVPDGFGGGGGRLYRTGDLVRWTVFGELEFLGRVDEQVKIRGFRVEPGEVEAVLREHPDVHDAAVLVRRLDAEPSLVAYVVGPGELRDWCRRRLPAYLVPSVTVPVDALPLTVQGKLDVAALPEPRPAADVEFTPPESPTEMVIAQIWAEVLGLERVGLHEDFFAAGGHSLRAVAAASRLRAAFDCPIQVRDLFANPTVAQLADEVEHQLIEQISAMSDDEIDLSLTVDH